MPRPVKERRRESRQPIPRVLDPRIEITLADGRTRRLRLLEVSLDGVSFEVAERMAGLEPRATLPNARLAVGPHAIAGHLVVFHVTRGPGAGYRCGARFVPGSEAAHNQLVELVSQLEALPVS